MASILCSGPVVNVQRALLQLIAHSFFASHPLSLETFSRCKTWNETIADRTCRTKGITICVNAIVRL